MPAGFSNYPFFIRQRRVLSFCVPCRHFASADWGSSGIRRYVQSLWTASWNCGQPSSKVSGEKQCHFRVPKGQQTKPSKNGFFEGRVAQSVAWIRARSDLSFPVISEWWPRSIHRLTQRLEPLNRGGLKLANRGLSFIQPDKALFSQSVLAHCHLLP